MNSSKLPLAALLLALTVPCAPADEKIAAQAGKLAAEAEKQSQRAVPGRDQWLFLGKELAHLAKPLDDANTGAAIKVIGNFQKALAAENVDLVLLLVPAKAEIYPDKLADAKADAFAARQADLQKKLGEAGVKSIDLAKAYHEHRAAQADALLYCARDTHWSPLGAKLAAELAFAAVKDAPWLAETKTGDVFKVGDAEPLEITGDLLDEAHAKPLGPEKITLWRAGIPDGAKISPAQPADVTAPIILLGDSHTLVFSEGASSGFHCQGAGLIDHLQAAFGQKIHQISSPDSGGQNARKALCIKARSAPDFWKSKKLVLWAFSVRELTEGRWTDLPIKK